VRELKNAIEFAVAMGPPDLLEPEHLPATLQHRLAPVTAAARDSLPTDYREAKSHFERTYLQEVLKRFGGRINLTAKRSGLSKVTLIEKIRRYEIDIPTIKYQAHLRAAAEAV
jgi:DNA-binding NtrC family response regulator